MRKKFYVEELFFEITRKCNMSCPHCLRGECQDKDITREVIDRVLDHVGGIRCIVFSGGEPSLNPEAMMYALDACKKRNIPIDGFFLATNGKEVSETFIRAVHAWHRYYLRCVCRMKDEDANRMVSGEELMGLVRRTTNEIMVAIFDEGSYGFKVALSADTFHEAIPYKNVKLLMELPGFSADAVRDFTKEAVLNEGRARTLFIPQKKREKHDREIIHQSYGDISIGSEYDVGRVYVNADGLVLGDCDLSYERQEDEVIPHYSVFDPDWTEQLSVITQMSHSIEKKEEQE